MRDLLTGLFLVAEKAQRARYYVTLENKDSSSGFYLEAQAPREARTEIVKHLAKYPSWDVGWIYLKDTKERIWTVRQLGVA